QADARHGGTHAGVFGDVSSVVLGYVQVGPDKDPSAGGQALGTEIGKAQDVHGGIASDKTYDSKSAGRREVTNQVRGARAGRRPCRPRWSAARYAARSTLARPPGRQTGARPARSPPVGRQASD